MVHGREDYAQSALSYCRTAVPPDLLMLRRRSNSLIECDAQFHYAFRQVVKAHAPAKRVIHVRLGSSPQGRFRLEPTSDHTCAHAILLECELEMDRPGLVPPHVGVS